MHLLEIHCDQKETIGIEKEVSSQILRPSDITDQLFNNYGKIAPDLPYCIIQFINHLSLKEDPSCEREILFAKSLRKDCGETITHAHEVLVGILKLDGLK